MKKNVLKTLSLVLAITCILLVPVQASATAQGTDGTELEVMQPENLEIQLGEAWAGVEFELKTDAGMYPGTITVGEDGILRLEIGGSNNYILTCLNSETESPGETANSGTTASIEAAVAEITQSTADEDTATTEAPVEAEAITEVATVAGIPVAHLVMFGGGLVIAIGVLIAIHFHQKRRENYDSNDGENDEF